MTSGLGDSDFPETGSTARMVSKCHAPRAVIAATPNPRVAAKLALAWGVILCLSARLKIWTMSLISLLRLPLPWSSRKGDLVIVTAGVRAGVPGTTNMLKVHRV